MRHVLAAALIAIVLAACSKKDKPIGPFVAEGDGVFVTAKVIQQRLDEQSPFVRARYASLERKKEFLENLIRFELLAKEARKRGLDRDPEIVEALEKIMVQKLVRDAFETAKDKPSNADVASYYEEHRDEFVKPERVRAQIIWLAAPAGSAQRASSGAEARKLLGRVKREGANNPLAFSNLARDASQDAASKPGGGDLGYRTRAELAAQYGGAVADAAFSLKTMSQESGVVESPHGFAILKLTARQPASSRTLDEVREQLAARIAREKRTKAFDEFVKKLRVSANITVNDAELEKIAAAPVPPGDSAAPASQAAGAGAR